MRHALALVLLGALALGAGLWAAFEAPPAPTPKPPDTKPDARPAPAPSNPTPAPQPAPAPAPPCPGPGPCPNRPHWDDRGAPVGAVTIDGPSHAGQDVQADLPVSERIHNVGSRVDGAGMCVMSSIEMAARYAGLEQMRGLRDWCARQPGGGYPEKVDRQIAAYCAAKGVPVPPYAQYVGPADAAALRAALGGNRIACVTYGGRDGVRYRGPIDHMVCCVGALQQTALLDNNDVGDADLLWMPESDFLARWPDRRGVAWLFAWLAPGAVPAPHN